MLTMRLRIKLSEKAKRLPHVTNNITKVHIFITRAVTIIERNGIQTKDNEKNMKMV